MGADPFAEVGKRQLAIAGLAGIALEQYAACLGRQLAARIGLACSVQLVHSSDAHELFRDLSDASERRFGELAPAMTDSAGAATDVTEESMLARTLAGLTSAQRRAHVESAVLRVVCELNGAPTWYIRGGGTAKLGDQGVAGT